MHAPKPANPAIPRTAAELSEFLLRACHDLRAPIRTIRVHAEILDKDSPSITEQHAAESLDFIDGGARQANALLDGLTDYALALQIDPSAFLTMPLDVIVSSAMAKLSAGIRERGADIRFNNLPAVRCDADRLIQMFEHLLDYSLRNPGPSHPDIHISAEPHADGWLIRVHDNGAGIEPEFHEQAFTPFARVRGNERPGPGLAICRVIVERHGGRIWLESEPGQGATFCFTLPAD